MSEVVLEDDETQVLKTLDIDAEKLSHYMNLFSQWIATQRYLPQNFSESCRKKFLLWAKLDFEKAKKKFKNFCYNPSMYKEFYCNRISTFEDDVRLSHEMFYITPIQKLTPKSYKVTLGKVRCADNLDILPLARFTTMFFEYTVHKGAIVAGEIFILDMERMKPHHYTKLFNATYLKLVKFCILSCPSILKNIFVVNCHPILEKGINLIRSVLPQKLAERIRILGSPNDLHEHVPLECLPSDYGGDEESFDHSQEVWKKFWLSQKDFVEELYRFKPIGPIPEEFLSYDNEFGVDVDFRIHKDITVSGEACLFDMEGLRPHHYAKLFNPTYLKFIRLAVINYPFLVKNLFIINCHPLLEKGIGLIKSVIPQKIADRVIILSDLKDLDKHIPKECLPEDYGGSERSLVSFRSSWEEYLLNQKDFYEELDRCKPSGSVPEEFKVYEGEYGADGSFRKLNID
ncbi:hypothetical protein Trydic_g23270 [Trypoxylus dichotomus]